MISHDDLAATESRLIGVLAEIKGQVAVVDGRAVLLGNRYQDSDRAADVANQRIVEAITHHAEAMGRQFDYTNAQIVQTRQAIDDHVCAHCGDVVRAARLGIIVTVVTAVVVATLVVLTAV